MRALSTIPLLLVLGGCAEDAPHWALDLTFLAPDGPTATGLVTWQVYRKAWKRSFKSKHYLCSVLVELEGTTTAADCSDCVAAYTLEPVVIDDDCGPGLADDALFVSSTRLGVTGVVDGGPHPGQSSVGWVDYGSGWELHGWAYPDALQYGETVDEPTWSGTEPFLFAPSSAWDLTGATPGIETE